MTESTDPTPAAAEPVPTCPIDGSTDFKHIPTTSQHFTCLGGCGKVWHESDLSGERFDYLKAHP